MTPYSSSPAGSRAQFNWEIRLDDSAIMSPTNNNNNFSISSTANPFTIGFKDVPLQLLDQGLDTERWAFQTTLQKVVFPKANFGVKCYYNSTLFAANLYTKKAKDNVPTPSSSSRLFRRDPHAGPSPLDKRQDQGQFKEWDYAIDATQSIGGGTGVPDCYEYDGAKPDEVGKRVTKGYEGKTAGDFCSCVYGNWDLK